MITYCDFLAGCIGGACGTLIGHPLDTVKTWQQTGNTRIAKTVYEIIIRNNGVRDAVHSIRTEIVLFTIEIFPSFFRPEVDWILSWHDVSGADERNIELDSVWRLRK